jgi:transposase
MRPPARYGYVAPSVERQLGALPVVAEFCRRLDLAGIVDRACPVRDIAALGHGQVVEALVANRLTSPSPLVRVEDWAREWAVAEVFGIAPSMLNDDRVGRALDALAPRVDQVVGSVGARAVTTFGIDIARLHWDMTSISLYGDYDDPDEGFVTPAYGHPKDRRVDLKQVQTGIAVTGDGGIPVLARPYDGNAAEVSQVVEAMTALRRLADERSFLLVGDSKLVSYPNLAAMHRAGVRFIAPASKAYVPAQVLAAQDWASATPVAYLAARDRAKRADQRGSYRVVEDTMTLSGKPKRTRDPAPTLRLRRVFVWSSADAAAAHASRAKKLDRARGDLDRLARGLGSRHYPDQAAVDARLQVIARTRRVAGYLHAQVGTRSDGKPTLTWWLDQAAIDAEAASDGWYALLTNLDPAEADPAEVLRRYKGQEVVERRYGSFKGPLAVAPLFLKSTRRIHALISVICLALLIFCLVERAVRLAIAPADKLPGLWANRPAKPTGRLIFTALARLRFRPASGSDPPGVPTPPPLQAKLLDLLDVDPTRPRWAH